jgi:putative ABC transport system permease protein
VTPEQLAALTPPGTTTATAATTTAGTTAGTTATATGYQMLYRLDAAATDAQVAAGRAAVEAAVPAGAATGSSSYLDVRLTVIGATAAFVPFVAAFGVLGLAMSTLIIGIVVSGAVGAATWRIGVLKSLGFTPTQVVRAYVIQALVPAAVGVGLGILIGNLLAVPVLGEQSRAFGGGTPSIPMWVDLAVAGAALALVACAALLPALRAGRMRSVEAIAVGRTPGNGRGRFARRVTSRLPLPAALSLGLANPFARPTRSAVTAAAVGFGVVGITFALGLGATLVAVETENNRDTAGQVVVYVGPPLAPGSKPAAPGPASGGSASGSSASVSAPDRTASGGSASGGSASGGSAPGGPASGGPAPDRTASDPGAVAAAVAAQPGTSRYYGLTETEVSVSGIVGTTYVTAYSGDASWAARPMISGSWFGGPGEAVVDTQFLKAADVRVGDTVTLTDHGRSAAVRIVGEVFDVESDVNVLTDKASLAGLGLDVAPSRFAVDLEPGADVPSYIRALNETLRPVGGDAEANIGEGSDVIATMEALIATLTLMIAMVAVLGVFNTVVLDTRERVHDLGVYKALGMTPRQTVTMVVTSVAWIGAVAGLVGVPLGIALHHYVVPLMGKAVATGMPHAYLAVYHLLQLVPLVLGGLVIATAGALLPAGWAAGTRTATALRTE